MATQVIAPIIRQMDEAELAIQAQRMERFSPFEIVQWAVEQFESRVCVAASMGDTVLVHMATQVDPDIEVVFLDTGFHFSETIVTVRQAQSRYGLNLRVERPSSGAPDVFTSGVDACCAARKVAVLEQALRNHDGWMTGVRRCESLERSETPILQHDRRGKVRICPIARWDDDDVARYVAEHDLVVNPLTDHGYPSIGCWPCTSRVAAGEDPRSGRWPSSEKTECGLQL